MSGSMSGVWETEPRSSHILRHRQTKGAENRHAQPKATALNSTLPTPAGGNAQVADIRQVSRIGRIDPLLAFA